ncbi:catalase [Photobacterium leiognathi]|uniref:catalase n=1 Tax=Photobacterium leiognathi TaxID=553611 RepID=UPI002981D165|nr:catalase [Photobacterium leiognathi]
MLLKASVIAVTLALTFSAQAANLTRDNGADVGDNQNSITAGANGSVLLQDVHLIQKLQRFGRERVPERVVHARGTGAHGVFVASGDFSDLTMASLLAKNGKETPVFVRFSTVVHGQGSPEYLRDPRGFATKFYTDEGNWDLVGNHIPVFFIRDAIKFPDMVHSLKPSPVTNLQEPSRFFDFFSHNPSATHMLTQLYSNMGTPASYREMDGFGVHAYKFINEKGEVKYVKFHWKSQQGIKNLNPRTIGDVAKSNFNHLTSDLYSEIKAGNFPKWDLYVQVLTPKQLTELDYNGLDATKEWLNVPEKKVGTMTLNRIPDNFFQETEQAAFAPANTVTGIEPSEDRLLQGRVFSYSDTQMYRLGANGNSLPINRPKNGVVNYNQNGMANHGNTKSDVNYEASSYEDITFNQQARSVETQLEGTVQQLAIKNQRNFYQAGVFWNNLNEQQQKDLITNFAGDLSRVEDKKVQNTILSFMMKADVNYGTQLTKAVGGNVDEVKALTKAL